MRRKILTLCLILILLLSSSVFISAQEELDPAPEFQTPDSLDQYLRLRGDMLVIFGIGGFVPLYTHDVAFGDFHGMELFPGVGVMLGLDIYWDSNFRMGASVSFSSAKGINENFVYFLPISFRAIYELRAYSFSFPLGAEIAVSVGSYREMLAINYFKDESRGILAFYAPMVCRAGFVVLDCSPSGVDRFPKKPCGWYV